jgi:SAM-dependent methyltransferase
MERRGCDLDYMEMIARLGEGNAHPGGFAATLRLVSRFPFEPGMKVLEVGCGTGRTACCLARLGCEVTALEPRRLMLDKAGSRFREEGVRVTLLEAAAEAMPLPDNRFDRIIAESVTIFTDADRSLKEYLRVLKPGGLLLDRELMAAGTLPSILVEELASYYGVDRLRPAREWLSLLAEAGFISPALWDRRDLRSLLWEDVVLYPDPHQRTDRELYRSPTLWETARQHEELLNANHSYLEHAVLVARKPLAG